MQTIVKGIDQINRVVTWVVVILLATMSVVVFAQVIYRFVLEAPLTWSEEVARYLMVWITFLGASLGVRNKALIGMEVAVGLLPPVLKRAAINLVSLITFCFLLVVLYYGIKMTGVTARQFSPAMQIPMSWPYLAVPVGAVLMLMNTVAVNLERWGGQR
ncbi:hypothetical protein SY88_09235 [Clostridiales bacterium PH28_bin88]|nr:hypothetical protein SY88_09235 [Clostridiales bacterium PH28_bin88]